VSGPSAYFAANGNGRCWRRSGGCRRAGHDLGVMAQAGKYRRHNYDTSGISSSPASCEWLGWVGVRRVGLVHRSSLTSDLDKSACHRALE
jgi:hypothetical protein